MAEIKQQVQGGVTHARRRRRVGGAEDGESRAEKVAEPRGRTAAADTAEAQWHGPRGAEQRRIRGGARGRERRGLEEAQAKELDRVVDVLLVRKYVAWMLLICW